MSLTRQASCNSNPNNTSVPLKKYDVMTAETDANNKGTKEAKTKSKLKISIAKTMAATGALNMDDIAPAVAQPMSNIRVLVFIWNNCATFEPKAAPVLTAGPCNPADPPNPTVIGAVINEANILYRSMIPLFLEMEYSVVEIP